MSFCMTPLAEAWFPVVWATQLKAVDRVAAAIREITLLLIVAFAGVHLPHATKPIRFFSGPRGVTVSTLDPESGNRGSNPREACNTYGTP